MQILLLVTSLLARGLEGAYRSPDGTAIRLECTRGLCQGTILTDKDPARVGKLFLKDLRETNGTWKGLAILPNGWEADATLRIPASDSLRIQVKKGLFSRTKDWVRIP